jgi:hypothetical protein
MNFEFRHISTFSPWQSKNNATAKCIVAHRMRLSRWM